MNASQFNGSMVEFLFTLNELQYIYVTLCQRDTLVCSNDLDTINFWILLSIGEQFLSDRCCRKVWTANEVWLWVSLYYSSIYTVLFKGTEPNQSLSFIFNWNHFYCISKKLMKVFSHQVWWILNHNKMNETTRKVKLPAMNVLLSVIEKLSHH